MRAHFCVQGIHACGHWFVLGKADTYDEALALIQSAHEKGGPLSNMKITITFS